MNKLLMMAACVTSLGLVSACDSTESDIIAAVAPEVNKSICQSAPLNRTRLRDDQWGDVIQVWSDEGFIEKVNNGHDFSVWIASFVEPRFKFTEKGHEIITDGSYRKEICMSERKVTEIIDMSEPYEERGRTYIDAEIAYENEVTADWAKGIKSMEDKFSGTGSVKYRLTEHDKNGWIIDKKTSY